MEINQMANHPVERVGALCLVADPGGLWVEWAAGHRGEGAAGHRGEGVAGHRVKGVVGHRGEGPAGQKTELSDSMSSRGKRKE